MAALATLNRKRGGIKAKLTAISKYFNENTTMFDTKDSNTRERIIIELELRASNLREAYLEFQGVQEQIEATAEDCEEQYEERNTFEDRYYTLLASLTQFIKANTVQSTPTDLQSTAAEALSEHSTNPIQQVGNIKLPQIILPTFTGEYDGWLEFRDTFNSLIHENQCLGDIQKFHYLRASLKGSAARIIQSIEVSMKNYGLAWELLCERFENTNLLINTHIKALFNLPAITRESSSELRNFIDQISKNIRCLEVLNQPTDQWDMLLIYIITSKLEKTTVKEWEERRASYKELPTLTQMIEFLKQKAILIETLEPSKGFVKSQQKVKAFTTTETKKCLVCNENHFIYNCQKFLTLSIASRIEKIKSLKLCMNCLKPGHISKVCSGGKCRKCGATHNTLLHIERHEKDSSNQNEVTSASEQTKVYNSKVAELAASEVILSTALVQIQDTKGYFHTARALLDCGAQSNFISKSFCNQLGVLLQPINMAVVGISQVQFNISHKCEVKIQSLHNLYETTMSCLVLDKLSEELPGNQIDDSTFVIPQYLRLADPSYNKPSKIDMIIGAGSFWQLLCVGKQHCGPNAPVLQKTKLGWIVTGSTVTNYINNSKLRCHFEQDINLKAQLERFWHIEEEPSIKILSDEEHNCEEIFETTHKRNSEGRFTVMIPLKETSSSLGDSRQIALKRFNSLEKRMGANPDFKLQYTKFMSEYELLGHMTELKNPETNPGLNYLPHHGVINQTSSTTKLRVVFDGSAVTESGRSFNDIQMVGPTLQEELLSICLRFRLHTFIVCADVEKMYRQIMINEDQRNLQCILWRSDPNQQLRTYTLNTVTYGTASAPYLAVKCLQQIGREHLRINPHVSEIILSDFYVDDLITGGESEDELLQNIIKLRQALHAGCFNLRKWNSNSPYILKKLQSTQEPQVLNLGEGHGTKTLGIYWHNTDDLLKFKINTCTSNPRITKRSILAQISQIFDPLGLLGPVIINAKIILQRLWTSNITWDETVPPDIHNQWMGFKDHLHSLNTLRIARQVTCPNAEFIELHGFSDASQGAYGACVYLRSGNPNHQIVCNLLMAKSRVAPLKLQTIPRLELCAALTLAKLVNKVKQSLKIDLSNIYLWTDSTIVLHWIQTQPNILSLFVANRITQIQSLTDIKKWHHIRSEQNPADVLSRGQTPNQLINNKMWWHGPYWLEQQKDDWPATIPIPNEELLEVKKNVKIFIVQNKPLIDTERFSKFNKLQRTVAYCKRFISNCRRTEENKASGPITQAEINEASKILIKIDQQNIFFDEIKDLKGGNQISRKSNLLKLSPFIDREGIIRVGGRLHLLNDQYDKRHPIVLGKSHFAMLILRKYHEDLGHAGVNFTLSASREKYWITSARSMLKSISHSCIKCFKMSPKILTPLMGHLPAERITPAPVFYNTGVDYAGPFMVKDRQGRGCKTTKAYLCLFVCMCTKAIHIELATELSKDSFIAALKRFIARRGKPNSIQSDNGTNFVGAKNEMDDILDFFKQTHDDITTSLTNEGINWQFIPPRAPHFGGLWEASIKQAKISLKKIIGNTLLTYEQLYTILTQVEAILNSRPLTPLSSDPTDLCALTPGHFMIGRPLTSAPEEDLTNITDNRLTKYKLLQKCQQQVWNRWKSEYISILQIRQKWHRNYHTLKEGVLVLIKDELSPPLQWPLGRIVQIFPGPDGIARVATVRTAKGVFKRAFSKLCPLPSTDTIVSKESLQGGGHGENLLRTTGSEPPERARQGAAQAVVERWESRGEKQKESCVVIKHSDNKH